MVSFNSFKNEIPSAISLPFRCTMPLIASKRKASICNLSNQYKALASSRRGVSFLL